MQMTRAVFVLGVVAALISGCSGTASPPLLFSQQPGGGHQKVEEISISKKKFISSLTQGDGVNDVRLVEVYRRERKQFPQYRIFDIRKGSPYQLLGLEDGDIILAADDHIIYEPAGFRTFVVQYLRSRPTASLTVSRGGVTALRRYTFVE